MTIPKHITYLDIAFHLIAITAFTAVLLMFFLVAFTDVIQLPKEEAIDYILGEPIFRKQISNH